MSVSVIEQRTYRLNGPHSYLNDLATVAVSPGIDTDASHRLAQHEREVQHEVEQESREGQRVLQERAALAEYSTEVRDATTSTLAGFTTPQYLLDQMALYRGIERHFTDQTTILPMPRYGMQMHVPQATGGSQVATAGEGTLVVETDMTGQDLVEDVATVAGQSTISIQLYDRSMTGGGSFDAVLARQMQEQLDQATDIYVISAAIAAGSAVTGAATWTDYSTFLKDIAAGREVLTDTNGVRFRPTHVFTTSDLFDWIALTQLDAEKRPIIVPNVAFDEAQVEARLKGFTGVNVGTMLWFYDDNIPASGANTQILVSRPREILTLEDTPQLRISPQTKAGTLEVVVQLTNYICAIPRYADATAVITGGAYPLTDK